MGVNKTGAVVPWVNVLSAHARETDRPVAVLFEQAAARPRRDGSTFTA